MAALEKGTGFELKLVELFKQQGYHVTHNIKMKGRSGAEHQIDVLAEYQAPLHTSSVIIEAKSYENNIDKDIIMKLISIQQDLAVDRAILATTSDFTPGALQTAQQYSNVELWDRQKITSLLGEMQLLDTADSTQEQLLLSTKVISAKLSSEDIKVYAGQAAEKRSKGGFLGRGKVEEKVLTVSKFLYPYYDVDMEAKIRTTEKTGWFSKEQVVTTVSSRTGIDGNTGAIIDVTDQGISYDYAYLSNLSSDEIQLLYYVSKVKAFEKRNLSAMGWTANKISKVVNSLTGKGILQQIKPRPAIYKTVKKYPYDPATFISLMEKYQPINDNSSDKKIENTFQPSSISTAFAQYWSGCDIQSIDLVYYPYYAIVYERKEGNRRLEVIDGISGSRQEYLEGIVSATIVI